MNNLAQFITIRGDELLFQSRCFEFNRNVIAVGEDQAIATLKALLDTFGGDTMEELRRRMDERRKA